jgi:hypothetical protein
MTTDKHCGLDARLVHFSGSLAQAHSLSALEQSACYVAQLAISRWINASAQPALPPASAAQLARADWFAQAQQHFQEWLGCGGFAQYDIADSAEDAPAEPPAAAEPSAAPAAARPLGNCIDVDIL